MSDGVLYKYNATTWSKSQCKKFNASTVTDGNVRHANASAWFDKYPMETLVNQTFNVQWTQPYNGSGVSLDAGTFGNHPRSGDSVNFYGLFGFDRTAMQNFVAGGIVQWIKITVMFADPSHSGNPTVDFYPHVYTSKPPNFDGINANSNYKTTSQFFQTGANFTRTIQLPAGAWLGGQFGGVVTHGPATAANSARFAGTTTSHNLNAYNTTVEIQVLK